MDWKSLWHRGAAADGREKQEFADVRVVRRERAATCAPEESTQTHHQTREGRHCLGK
jgi:hypothetical protein